MSHGAPPPRHVWDDDSDGKLLRAIEKHGLENWMTGERLYYPVHDLP